MSLLTLSCSSHPKQSGTDEASQTNAPRVLVAYFSCTGNTERVAKAIAEGTEATLYRITPAKAYTATDLNWRNDKSRSSIEMTNEQSRPALGGDKLNLQGYDVVFLGYPIWWNLCPRLLNTFIEQYKFEGVTVYPFATSGSSSIDNSASELRRLYPNVKWQTGRLCNDSPEAAAKWAKSVVAAH